MMKDYCLEVDRTELESVRIVDLPLLDSLALNEGQASLRIDRFALTANNITYGVAGDKIGYWQFFSEEGRHGRIPVWGKATVIDPGTTQLVAGDSYYGYFPMATYLVVEPDKVSSRGFVDSALHRSELPPAYNRYLLMNDDNGFPPGQDNHRMVYYPLFVTSFSISDFLVDNNSFGADSIIISSASSKTSISLAYLLKGIGRQVVGLTSPGNQSFVQSCGLYDDVVLYGDITALDPTRKAVFIDMAGNRSLLESLHHHFSDNLVYSAGVGITHRDQHEADVSRLSTLPGAKPRLFFAPSQIQKRTKEIGDEAWQAMIDERWSAFAADVDQWITIKENAGPAEMEQTYREVLSGAAPDCSHVIVPAT